MACQHQTIETIELYEESIFATQQVPHPQWTVIELNRGLRRVKEALPVSIGLQVGELFYLASAHTYPVKFEQTSEQTVGVRIFVAGPEELQSFRRKFWDLETADLVAWLVRSCVADRPGLKIAGRHRLLKLLGHHFGCSVARAARSCAKSLFWSGWASASDDVSTDASSETDGSECSFSC